MINIGLLVISAFLTFVFLFKVKKYLAFSIIFILIGILSIINYTSLSNLGGINLGYFRVPLLIVGFLFVFTKLPSKYSQVFKNNIDVFVFILWNFLICLFALDQKNSLLYAIWLFLSLVFLLDYLYSFPSKEKAIKIITNNYLIIFLVPIALSISSFLGFESNTSRFMGAFHLRHIVAWAAAILISALVSLMINGYLSKRFQVPRIAAFVLAGLLSLQFIVLSGTRSAFLAVLVIFLFFLFYYRRKILLHPSNILAMLLFLAGVYFYAENISNLKIVQARYQKTLRESQTVEDNTRAMLFNAYFEYVRKNPIVGTGLANSAAVFRYISYDGKEMGPHNTYLAILTESGVVGFMIFLVILFRSVKLLFNSNDYDFKMSVILLSICPLIISIFESNSLPGQALFLPFYFSILLPRIQFKSNRY